MKILKTAKYREEEDNKDADKCPDCGSELPCSNRSCPSKDNNLHRQFT
jgi:hypothetical protein